MDTPTYIVPPAPVPELIACRGCGQIILRPATVCSDYCYGEVYGESLAAESQEWPEEEIQDQEEG